MTSLISRWRVGTVFRSLLSIFVVASPICHTHLQESSDLVLIASNSTGSYRLTGSQIDSADTGLCISYMADWFCSRCRIYACYLAVALTQDALHCPSWPFFCASQEVPVGSIAYFSIFIYSFHASVFLWHCVCVSNIGGIHFLWDKTSCIVGSALTSRLRLGMVAAVYGSCSAFHKLHCF